MKKHAKLGMVGHVSHTLFWELEAGKLEIQIQPGWRQLKADWKEKPENVLSKNDLPPCSYMD